MYSKHVFFPPSRFSINYMKKLFPVIWSKWLDVDVDSYLSFSKQAYNSRMLSFPRHGFAWEFGVFLFLLSARPANYQPTYLTHSSLQKQQMSTIH